MRIAAALLILSFAASCGEASSSTDGTPAVRPTQGELLAALNRHSTEIRRRIPATQGIGIDTQNAELVLVVNATGAAAEAVRARDAELERLTGVPIQIRAMSSVHQEGPAPVEETNNEAAGGVHLALLDPSDASDAAALEGYLHVEGRCLYVTDRRGSGPRAHPAFLIRDARWDAQQGVLVAHGRRYRPGQRVRLGGSTAADPRLLRWRQPPDPSCDNASVFVTGMIEPLSDPGGR